MKAISISLAAALLSGAPLSAHACGACVEDKVAATYDHAVIEAAIAGRRQVVFVAVDGPLKSKDIKPRIAAAAARVRGIERGTLRIAANPPAFSFAMDAAQDPRSVVVSLQRALRDVDAHLTLLRIMRDGRFIEPG